MSAPTESTYHYITMSRRNQRRTHRRLSAAARAQSASEFITPEHHRRQPAYYRRQQPQPRYHQQRPQPGYFHNPGYHHHQQQQQQQQQQPQPGYLDNPYAVEPQYNNAHALDMSGYDPAYPMQPAFPVPDPVGGYFEIDGTFAQPMNPQSGQEHVVPSSIYDGTGQLYTMPHGQYPPFDTTRPHLPLPTPQEDVYDTEAEPYNTQPIHTDMRHPTYVHNSQLQPNTLYPMVRMHDMSQPRHEVVMQHRTTRRRSGPRSRTTGDRWEELDRQNNRRRRGGVAMSVNRPPVAPIGTETVGQDVGTDDVVLSWTEAAIPQSNMVQVTAYTDTGQVMAAGTETETETAAHVSQEDGAEMTINWNEFIVSSSDETP